MAGIDRQLHRLLVQPSVRNHSLLLGLLSHAERAVRGVPVENTVTDRLGAGLSRAGEKVDFELGQLTGLKRTESIKLTADHIKELDRMAHALDKGPSGPARNQVNRALREHNSLLGASARRDPYNHNATLDSLVQLAEQDPRLEVHLRDVEIPSALGEAGKDIKNFLSDTALLYGTGSIADKLNRLASEPSTRHKSSPEDPMDHLSKAAALFEEAADLLNSIPTLERSYELATKLASAGVIERDEVEKRASIFANDLEGAEVMVQDALKAVDTEKTASTFDTDDAFAGSLSEGSGGRRYSGFDQFCADAAS